MHEASTGSIKWINAARGFFFSEAAAASVSVAIPADVCCTFDPIDIHASREVLADRTVHRA